MDALLTALTSNARHPVQAAIAELAPLPLAPAHLALCAWVWHRWDAASPAVRYQKYQLFQANRLGWRRMDDPAAGDEIRAALTQLLQQQLPEEWEPLLQAAALFTCAYPEDVYVGTLADGYFYELHDHRQASIYYKQYLAYLSYYPTPERLARRAEVAKSQIRLAMERSDYWQARSLCEKLLRTAPGNKVAYQYLKHIQKRLG